MPESFVITALSVIDGLEFLQFFADKTYEFSQFSNENPLVRQRIEENKITNEIFFDKARMIDFAKNPETFDCNLLLLAKQMGLNEISEDQESRLKVIKEYYIALRKNAKLQEIQEEREKKLESLKEAAKDIPLEELFERIKKYMNEEFDGFYAKKNEYKAKFSVLFKIIKNRDMNKDELENLENFISGYFKEKEIKLLSDDEFYKNTLEHCSAIQDRKERLVAIADTLGLGYKSVEDLGNIMIGKDVVLADNQKEVAKRFKAIEERCEQELKNKSLT